MASDEEFQISDKEIKKLKMDAEDVDSALRACKTYLDQAENEIKKLESDIQKDSFGIKTAAAVTGIAAVLMTGGGRRIVFWTHEYIIKTIVDGYHLKLMHALFIIYRFSQTLKRSSCLQ